jgi:hypothetical protein
MDDVLDTGGYKRGSAPQQFEVAEGSFVLVLPSGGCIGFQRMQVAYASYANVLM